MLTSTLGWLRVNPLVVTLIIWPLITAAVNLAWQDASAYVEAHPRFAAFKKLIQKWGLSPRGTIALIGALFVKANLPPPPPDSGRLPKSGPVPLPLDDKFGVPGSNFLRGIGFAIFAMFVFCCFGLVACGGAQTHLANEKAAYATDDGICVTEATDHDGGSQCLDKYQRLYSVFWPDSGVTVCEVGFDAGSDGGK